MRKFVILIALLGILFGCKPQAESDARPLAYSAPVMPVRLTSDTMQVVLTDYLPLLCEGESETIEVVDTRSIQSLPFEHKGIGFAIPVLPNKPVRQSLVSLGYEDGKLIVGFFDGVENPRLNAYVQNMPISDEYWQKSEGNTWLLNIAGCPEVAQCAQGRAWLRVFAEDNQYLYNDMLLPLQDGEIVTQASQLNRHDPQAQVLYSILIDRFHNGNTANDWKMNSPEVLDIVDYQGGDLAGITAKISEGYFDHLGVNTLWISPVTQNPWDAWGLYPFPNGNKYDPSKQYTKFSGYHGYWPIYATALEQRFGTPDELRALLDTAHAHNMNVILDYVANHMHINSPTLQQHPDWHTDSILPDGRRNFELWDEARLTTWFDKHIPSLDLERKDICEAMTDSALYWLANYDLDGFRHDACKHIPEGYWRLLGQKIAKRWPGRPIWMIGETYGSPELIGSYVKPGMLNAQFDFNVYFTAREALCGYTGLDAVLNNELTSLKTYGAHHTMGNISGNHDQIRFASIAGGAIDIHSQGKEEGWTREVGIGNADKAYKRALLLEVLNMTLPGVPCIYQGDEYAEVGGNDPDNRHMMRFDNLSHEEQEMRAKVSELIHLRRNSMPLLYGDLIPLIDRPEEIIYQRVYLGERVTVIINRRNLSYKIEFDK